MSRYVAVLLVSLCANVASYGAWTLYDDHSGAGAYGECDAAKWVNAGIWDQFWGRHPSDANMQYARGAIDSTERYLVSVSTFNVPSIRIAWDSRAYQLWDAGNYAYGFAFGTTDASVSVAQNMHHIGTHAGQIAINDSLFGSTNRIAGDSIPLYHYVAEIQDGSVVLSIYTHRAGRAPQEYTSADLLETITATGTAEISGQDNRLYFYQDYNPLTNVGAGFYTYYWTVLGNVWVDAAAYSDADFDKSGLVDMKDFAHFASQWLKSN